MRETEEYPAGWKYAVFSDTHGDNIENANKSCINDVMIQRIAANIVQEKPDFVLAAGDLVNGWFKNGGTGFDIQYSNWKGAMGPVYLKGIRVYPIRGNHDSGPERLALPPLPARFEPPPDTSSLLKKAFMDAFNHPYIPGNGPAGEEGLTYSFVHKNAFIIALDQYSGGQHRINQGWLERQLAGNTSPHVFVCGHEFAFAKGRDDNLGFYPEERDIFWDSIGNAGARIYLCGHGHFYNRTLIPDNAGNHIRQIVAGTGGSRLRAQRTGMVGDNGSAREEYNDNSHHGYVLVTVDGQNVTVQWKAMVKEGSVIMWRVLDSFGYTLPALDRAQTVRSM